MVILGLGNTDRGDDGAGVMAARIVAKSIPRKRRSTVKIILGHETPEYTTGEMRTFRPDCVLIFDAAIAKRRAGALFIVERELLVDEALSTHHLSLAMLVRYLEESVGCRVVVLGIQPRATERGSPLSPPVQKAVNRLADWVREALKTRP
jgi:hydrogenase maturation protease HycI